MTNDQRYLVYESFFAMEDGHSKKLKARHNKKLKNNEKRFYDNMGYEHDFTTDAGDKWGYSNRNGGGEISTKISKDKKYKAKYNGVGDIEVSRKLVRMKGSDLVGSHEYSHALTHNKLNDMEKEGTLKELKKKY